MFYKNLTTQKRTNCKRYNLIHNIYGSANKEILIFFLGVNHPQQTVEQSL